MRPYSPQRGAPRSVSLNSRPPRRDRGQRGCNRGLGRAYLIHAAVKATNALITLEG